MYDCSMMYEYVVVCYHAVLKISISAPLKG